MPPNSNRSKAASPLTIEVVICTYNRARDLDRTLAALAAQHGAESVSWGILIVDNGSTDDTPQVVDAWALRGTLPGLRAVRELNQGLSHARARGVQESTAEWIAFVDDDNILEEGWIAGLADAVSQLPDAGGIGGRVIVDWVEPPPAYLDALRWCFAEQDHGSELRQIDNLVGAGMVLRRKALVESGWLNNALIADRAGKRLISGGDVEMVQRVKLAGYGLWYVPQCTLRHRITPERMRRKYVARLAFGLGVGAAEVNAVCWPGSYESWSGHTNATTRPYVQQAVRSIARAIRRREAFAAAFAQLAFAAGFIRGVARIKALPPGGREELVGAGKRMAELGREKMSGRVSVRAR